MLYVVVRCGLVRPVVSSGTESVTSELLAVKSLHIELQAAVFLHRYYSAEHMDVQLSFVCWPAVRVGSGMLRFRTCLLTASYILFPWW
jgi:hypothetical protein